MKYIVSLTYTTVAGGCRQADGADGPVELRCGDARSPRAG